MRTGPAQGEDLLLYDLRHTFVTLAIARGVDVKTVSFVRVDHGEMSALTELSLVEMQVVSDCFSPSLYQELVKRSARSSR